MSQNSSSTPNSPAANGATPSASAPSASSPSNATTPERNSTGQDRTGQDRTGQDRTGRIIQTGILIEQNVEARYLRVGRAFTYGPIRRLFEEYAAEVRDHARILSRHLRDREGGRTLARQSGRRRRPRAADGPPILNPVSLYQSFDESFRAAERAIVFHRRATSQVDDRFLRKFMEVLAGDHSFHLDILGHLLADIRDRNMHLTPGRKLAPVDVPWVAAMFEGVVPPWRREPEGDANQKRWFINYM